MLPAETVSTWGYDELKSWVDNINISEHDRFDFKQEYEHLDPKRIRKAFASLANTKGGYLFFGIEDRTKNILGCPNSGDFNRLISDKLDINCIDPRPQWELLSTINVNGSANVVHIVEVKKLPRFSKPCISDSKIYVREPGRAREITRLEQLKSVFFDTETTILEDIGQLQTLVKNSRITKYNWTMLDGLTIAYLIKVKNYLISTIEAFQEESSDPAPWIEALQKLENGIRTMEQINQQSSISASNSSQGIVAGDNDELDNLISSASNVLEDFAVTLKTLMSEVNK